MHRHYIFSVVSGVLASFLTVLLYYKATFPSETDNLDIVKTRYNHVKVDGPIQPIPIVADIDQRWFHLGKALFNSPLLSGDNSISCASCHLTRYGGDDGFPVSTGVESKIGTRNSPTVLNAVFNFRQFWDGRSHSLSNQIDGPIHNPIEMNSNWQDIIGKLKSDDDFRNMFKKVSAEGVTKDAIVKAITVFEEGLITPDAPIDKFLLGELQALTEGQKRGWRKFQEFGCITCHQGVNIGGNLFQRLGRIDKMPKKFSEDLGLYNVTGKESDRHVFKVPSLRNIAETAPYFHDGSVATLEDAVTIMANIQLGRQLSQEDKEDLVALLQAFSAPYEERF